MDSWALRRHGDFLQVLARYLEYLHGALGERGDVISLSSFETSIEDGRFWLGFRVKRAAFRSVFQVAVGLRAGPQYALGDCDRAIWIEQLDTDEALWERLTNRIQGLVALDDELPIRAVGVEWDLPDDPEPEQVRERADAMALKILALFGLD